MCHHPHLLLQDGNVCNYPDPGGSSSDPQSSLLQRRFGFDPRLHPFPSSFPECHKDLLSLPAGCAHQTQGTLVTVTGQLMPSPGHGFQEVQACTSWRAVAHFKQSNQDTPQLWKDILLMMDFIPKYLQ